MRVGAISLALLIGLASGCGPGRAEVYSDPEQTINVRVNRQFVIALESNPTTGYRWEVEFDHSLLELVESKFVPAGPGHVIGAGGEERFTFRALGPGETLLTLTYRRPWEEKPVAEKVFAVNIK